MPEKRQERKEQITKADFARRVGISHQRASQLARKAWFPLARDGRVKWPEARDAWLEHREENLDPEARAQPPALQVPGEQPAPPVPSPTPTAAADPEELTSYGAARTALKQAQAELAQVRLRQQRGELVERDEVRADARSVMEGMRAGLLGLPGRVALLLEGRPATEIQEQLTDAVEALMADWHAGRFGGEA